MKVALNTARSCVVGLFSIGVLHLALSGDFSLYVNPRFFWLFIAAGTLLAVAAVCSPARLPVPRIALLLLVPLVLVWAAQPEELGASMARQQPPAVVSHNGVFPPLTQEVNQVGMRELNARMHMEPEQTIGAKVAIFGFAVRGEKDWKLARFTMSCCAADAVAYFADLDLGHWSSGMSKGLKEDNWYIAYGTVQATDGASPVISVDRIEDSGTPVEAYEY